ncbi:ATP-dependent DNA ligase [Neisseria sp. N95_16]|uniref:ATP-dependent DNA ligase n=1 Tax=Neisseria brasiliensis TaxID=2666100 RepID=A0A7X2KYZ9_9NEIS|nr:MULTISPECIES: ATP-dependent DNA ligase [Neisseria]MRN38582.1 ATP-dependent DNA ligase [Neisseria brasiliensis]PJO10501.1 ATP-dependent DNA ligase [Neisseria sp. N95_16]
MKVFKPMLAAKLDDIKSLNVWPILMSPKLDGIRCIVRDGVAYSRSNKPIRNEYIQQIFQKHKEVLNNLDGELIVGEVTSDDVYRTTNSAVMSIEGEPEFTFYIFDDISNPTLPFTQRLNNLKSRQLPSFAVILEQSAASDCEEVFKYEAYVTGLGYEGVILKDPNGVYKNGRSTVKESGMLKLKRFTDAEAVCIGYGELYRNNNTAFKNELGHTARSKESEGLVPANTLGYLLCRTLEGVDFKVGTGFSQAERDSLWQSPDDLIGKLVKYKYFDVGIKEAPRHPVFLGFRDEIDL